jgi:hypothetical protein
MMQALVSKALLRSLAPLISAIPALNFIVVYMLSVKTSAKQVSLRSNHSMSRMVEWMVLSSVDQIKCMC